MKKIRKFTLIELLVGIAIIGILAAMLFPALRAARAAAVQIDCLSKLKQNGVSYMLYVNAYETLWPDKDAPNWAPPAYWQEGWTMSNWWGWINDEFTNTKYGTRVNNDIGNTGQYRTIPNTVYFCQGNPSSKNIARMPSNYVSNRDLLINPAKSYYYQGRLNRVQVPEQVAILTEGNFIATPDPFLVPFNYYWYEPVVSAPHMGVSNVLFVDGHADSMKGTISPKNIGKFGSDPSNW